jgi:release factor glutamine methyltransferase
MEIYSPAEDSYLLQECVKKYLTNKPKNLKILDMGSGSGIQALTCIELGFKNILAADINSYSIKELRKKRIKAVKSNLFSDIPGRFDLILFNPPYLPESRYDKAKDTSGGKKGFETILLFLKQSKRHLKAKGTMLLLISSFSNPDKIINHARELGFDLKILKELRIFFEVLYVLELRKPFK